MNAFPKKYTSTKFLLQTLLKKAAEAAIKKALVALAPSHARI